jgi:flagellar biosynthetic protein FliS
MSSISDPQLLETPHESTQVLEHAVVLLLEGGQRFLAKAEEAVQHKDPMACSYFLKRVDSIVRELNNRLNHAEGGELVANLSRLYDWWTREVNKAGAGEDVDRLKLIASQMGEIRRSWEFVLFRGEGMSESPVA